MNRFVYQNNTLMDAFDKLLLLEGDTTIESIHTSTQITVLNDSFFTFFSSSWTQEAGAYLLSTGEERSPERTLNTGHRATHYARSHFLVIICCSNCNLKSQVNLKGIHRAKSTFIAVACM